MAITVDNSWSNSSTNSSCTVTVTAPPSGKLLIAFVLAENNTIDIPSGWTQRTSGSTVQTRIAIFYKIAGGSEPSSYTFTTPGTTTHMCAIVTQISGANSHDVTSWPIQTNTYSTFVSTLVAPGLTRGSANTIVFAIAATSRDRTFSSIPSGSWTTLRNQVGGNGVLAVVYQIFTSGGSTSDQNFSLSATADGRAHQMEVTMTAGNKAPIFIRQHLHAQG